jgi:hypothetical protein
MNGKEIKMKKTNKKSINEVQAKYGEPPTKEDFFKILNRAINPPKKTKENDSKKEKTSE